ncbi:MAG: ASCH domain-containing protein [Lachnospiraceae bacterium]|nr:ASCH domain-containing protein [Lachnospiraceae bacterium]
MLTLPIMGKWFNMILSGEKKEEYREIKPYYMTRFKKIFDMHPNSYIPVGTDTREIRFRNGYGSSRPEFVAECSLDIKTGREEWGAEPGKEYYTLKIHQITERSGC